MDILAEIQQRLQKYPAARYEVGVDNIRVLPMSDAGFTVAMIAQSGHFTVHFNGWHEEFTDAAEALNCFTYGLSEDCRLQEWRRGGSA